MVLEIGRLCVKTAGRDATKLCVVVEIVDETYVLVDGNTRRKNVNKLHLEPLNKVLKIKKGAITQEVKKAFEDEGIDFSKPLETKGKKEKQSQVKRDRTKKKIEEKTTKKKE